MKRAVHFGGGNIGRGFIGEVLHDNEFSITFVDLNDAMIDKINRDHGNCNSFLYRGLSYFWRDASYSLGVLFNFV